jgi:molecular chaperone GrpE
MNDDVNATVSGDTAASGATATAENPAGELAAAKAKADENYNKFLYAMADFENYKKRMERQLGDISMAGKRSVLLKMLPVLDNLERALSYEIENEGLKGGLNATLRAFENALASENVKAVSLKGTIFDPKLAEAIGTQPADGVAEDTVVAEAHKLYMIGDDVLRPAQVLVAKAV